MRKSSRNRIGLLRTLLFMAAALSLFANGGVFAHAHEFEAAAHIHSAGNTDGHKHHSRCPNCKGDERPVHCGANILMSAAIADPVHPVPVRQIAEARHSQMTGHLLAPESPPPRTFPVFDM